jgi:hypothetical protein
MTTDDAGPGNPFSPNEPRHDEPLHDPLVGQPQVDGVELDAYGVPVQDRPAQGRAYLVVAGGLICGAVSAWLTVMDYQHKVPGYLTVLGALLGFAVVVVPLHLLDLFSRRKRKQLGWVIMGMVWVAFILGLLGFSGLYTISSCNNC